MLGCICSIISVNIPVVVQLSRRISKKHASPGCLETGCPSWTAALHTVLVRVRETEVEGECQHLSTEYRYPPATLMTRITCKILRDVRVAFVISATSYTEGIYAYKSPRIR